MTNTPFGSLETRAVMQSNPQFSWAQACGFSIGQAAARRGNQFESLSRDEWRNAGDDYAQGYRQGFSSFPIDTVPAF